MEVCTVTQVHRRGAKPGGWGGHAGMFLNGAEIDTAAGYPRLRLVPHGSDLSDPDSGVGLSVNKIFTNVVWVAIPGRELFFQGGLAPEQSLDTAVYDDAVKRAAAAGWFAGITVSGSLMREKPRTMPIEEFIVRNSIGTDFAINFARTAYSARLPLRREAIGEVVAYLNEVNQTARRNGFTWNAYTNNCSHVIHNALAAAGVWDPKEARGPGLLELAMDVLSVTKALAQRRMSDFSFPANNFVRLYEAGNERPIDDARSAFNDHDVARTMRDGWTSTGPGALIATYSMHQAERNPLFTQGRDPFLFSVPMFWDKDEKFRRLTRHPPSSLTDLGSNLEHFRDRYARTLATQPDDGEQADFRAFADRFYDYIAEESRRTDARIAEYRRLA